MEQFLEKNQNPVMSVGSEGTVLYSNEASEPLLQEWGVKVGEKLPSSIVDIVQKVITQNNPEKMEVRAGKRVYLVVFHPLPEQESVNISGFNITDQKELEEKLRESEALEMTNLELADIIDIKAVQSLINDLYKLAHIPIGLNDLKGNVLVGVGWQDICTKFHRVCPETCKHCMESDTKLSSGVSPGEFKIYKCKNNMWDIATPIIVGGQHVGNAFSGQFFFEDEPLDYELFRSQARKYGFNEKKYIAALEKVPRLSREDVNTGMSFLITFANMVSQLGYSNLKLAKSLVERDALVGALQENRKDLDRAQAVVNIGSWRLDVRKNELRWSDENHRMFGVPKGTPLTYETFLSIVYPDDREYVDRRWKAGLAGEPYDIEHRIVVDGKIKWVREKAYIEFDTDGKVIGGFGITQNITERKKSEEALKKAHDNLEKLVEERTIKLENAYKSLKESEKGLAEAQKMAHIGNWEWDLATDKAYWSDEMYRIFGRNPQELAPPYNEYLNYVHPDDRDYFDNAAKKAMNGEPYSIHHRIVMTNGEERTVHIKSEVIFDENNVPIRIKGIVQDITESKKAEEKIKILANAVESSNDAIITLSLDGIITSWNKGAMQIYGYSSEEILGKNASILAPNNLKDETKKLIDRIKQGIKIQNYETSRLKKDSTLIDVSITLSPIFDSAKRLVAISGIAREITEQIKAKKSLAKTEAARKKEIHHRIKNNLQVISSLLDLQADKFDNPKVIEAFRESQNRVISMTLIHEELYKGEDTDTLNFSEYLEKLAENLFQIYRISDKNIHLTVDMEENALFDMDTAVPLGIIVNELVSNSLKHAFYGRDKGEIRIKLRRDEKCKREDSKSTSFILTVSDNGVGIPENLIIEDLDSLGIQLVTTLVDQLDGELELKKGNGTEFAIRFTVTEEK
ncbi:MAG TPA: PocR ligand-binding domain-containing protein [Methanosarcina sp.]|nr:PocR ligand-binding domain-containing protein [Methanosarcina sp.]